MSIYKHLYIIFNSADQARAVCLTMARAKAFVNWFLPKNDIYYFEEIVVKEEEIPWETLDSFPNNKEMSRQAY